MRPNGTPREIPREAAAAARKNGAVGWVGGDQCTFSAILVEIDQGARTYYLDSGVSEIQLPGLGAKSAMRREENRRFLEHNGPFCARRRRSSRSSPNYSIASHVGRLGVNGPIPPKIRGPFSRRSPITKRVLSPRVWGVSKVFV